MRVGGWGGGEREREGRSERKVREEAEKVSHSFLNAQKALFVSTENALNHFGSIDAKWRIIIAVH